MDSMMAYGGNNILDLTLNKVYQKDPSKFEGSGSSKGFNYSYAVTKAPTAKLVYGISTHNIVVYLKNVNIKIAPRLGVEGNSLDKNIALTAQGFVGISDGVFSFTSLVVSIENPDNLEATFVDIINEKVVPKIEDQLKAVPLPQLDSLFNTSLTPIIHTGQVISGVTGGIPVPAFEIGVQISGNTGIGVADAPASANISALNSGTATSALTIAMISDNAINVLIKALNITLSQSYSETESENGFGAGIKATIKATTPELVITNGVGKIRTRVSIDLQGGIQAPLMNWEWVDIPVPDIDVVINNTLSSEGNQGLIKLSIASLTVVIDWPTLLYPVESLVKSILNGILKKFKDKINAEKLAKPFPLFVLPSTIPGQSISATLSFDPEGFMYYKSSIRTLIRIKS
jgi:hypothetical protein